MGTYVVEIGARYPTSLNGAIRNLTYPTVQYDAFNYCYIDDYFGEGDWSVWYYLAPGTVNYNDRENPGKYGSPEFHITGLHNSTNIWLQGSSQWDGVWYDTPESNKSTSTDAYWGTSSDGTPPPVPKWDYYNVVDWSSFAIHGRMNGAESVEISDSEGGQNYIRDSFSVNRYHNQFYEDPWSFSKPNTTYQIWVRARNSYGVSAWSSPLTVTTGSAPTPSQPSSSPTGTKIDGGFDLSWGSSSGATSYILKYRSYAGTFTKPVSGTSTSLTGLEYGVTYYISVAAKNSSGTSPYNPEDDTLNPATTAPKTPAISNPSVTNNSITIHCDNGMTGNYDDIEIQRYTSGSSYIDSMFLSKSNYNAGIRDVTWTGLPQGTDYIFKARSSFGISGVTLYSVDWSNNISTSTNARPTDWKWTTAKDIYGHKVKGNDFSILASEWNIFTDRINQFRSYKLGPGQSYSFTTAVSVGDNKVYAYMFNQAIDAIDDIVYTGLSHKLPNQDCIASDFNVLMDKLNSIS